MGEAIVAKVVGGGAIHEMHAMRAGGPTLLEEQDFGAFDGIGPVVENLSGDGGAGRKAEENVLGVEMRAGDDGGPETFVLIEAAGDIAVPSGDEAVFALREAGEKEAAVGGSERGLSLVEGGDGGESDLSVIERQVGD
jgi:hypothetical protein